MYARSVLSNGLRIVTHDMNERESVSVGVIVGSGGRHEEDRLRGTAHFLEHIVFKGSRRFTCPQIKEQIEGIGGSLNAFTTEESTCYYAKVPSRFLLQACDVLCDMAFFPRVAKKDVDKERGVILEEIKMYQDLPQYFVLHMLDEIMWPGHPLGQNLAGTVDSVSRLSGADLRAFHKAHYVASNAVVAACGHVNHARFARAVGKRLNALPSGERSVFRPVSGSQQQPVLRCHPKETEQMHLALGMRAFSDNHPDKYAQNLLHVVLGGNMSSRLFNEVREKRGLAYSISSSVKPLQDTGVFLVRAGVDNRKLVNAVGVVLKELQRIRRSGVAEREFVRARDYSLGQVLLALEETMDHMLWIGENTVCRDRMQTLKELVRKIRAVTPADLKRVAREILRESRYNLAVVGPVDTAQQKALAGLLGLRL